MNTKFSFISDILKILYYYHQHEFNNQNFSLIMEKGLTHKKPQ